jgi:NADH dehydrogenase (ubiquinone) flavoprotein 2
MKACEDFLGIHSGHMTEDKLFSLLEVECLGACVNAPMVQINDDYYEDLTPETTVQLLQALKDSATISGFDASKVPRPGPQTYEGKQRMTCEPRAGLTSLMGEPVHVKDVMRTDGEL